LVGTHLEGLPTPVGALADRAEVPLGARPHGRHPSNSGHNWGITERLSRPPVSTPVRTGREHFRRSEPCCQAANVPRSDRVANSNPVTPTIWLKGSDQRIRGQGPSACGEFRPIVWLQLPQRATEPHDPSASPVTSSQRRPEGDCRDPHAADPAQIRADPIGARDERPTLPAGIARRRPTARGHRSA